MNDVQSRLIAAVTEPSLHAEVMVVTGWPGAKLALAAGWAARGKAGWRSVPTVRAMGAFTACVGVVALCIWWISGLTAVQRLSPVLAGLAVAVPIAAVALVALAISAAVLARVGGAAVRFRVAGEDTETIAVRAGDGYLVVEGWAYLDAHWSGSSPRPRVAARRVLDFADAEGLRVCVAVATSATALQTLYAAHGFATVPTKEVPRVVRLPHRLGARVVHLVRPVSSAGLGR